MDVHKPPVPARGQAPGAGTIRQRGQVHRGPPPSQAPDREFAYSDKDFRQVRDLIYRHAGIALAPGKRDMVYSRLSRRLRALGITDFRTYLRRLEEDPGSELQAFINALTTNLTSFFREPHHFDRLRQELQRNGGTGRPRQLWSCAASTGEEPYSMAISACEALESLAPPVRILATDVDTQVLETARRGVYSMERVADLAPALLRRYFLRGTGAQAGFCRVRPELQALIEFRPLNLLQPGYDVDRDVLALFCRNVMIYFDKPTQRSIISRLVGHLAPEGLLYTGHSENYLHAADLIVPSGRTLYRRAPGCAP